MNSKHLNQELSNQTPYSNFHHVGGKISATRDGASNVPVTIPADVDVDFTDVTFDTDIHFQLQLNGRIWFTNCNFLGKLVFLKCVGGTVNFFGEARFGSSIEITDCREFGFLFGDSRTNVSLVPRPAIPPEFALPEMFPQVLSVNATQCSALNLYIQKIAPELLFVAKECSESNFTIECDKIARLEFDYCRIRTLRIMWEQMCGLHLFSSAVELLTVPTEKVLELPIKKVDRLRSYADWKTLEMIARAKKTDGRMKEFVDLFCRSGEARLLNVANNFKFVQAENETLRSLRSVPVIVSAIRHAIAFNFERVITIKFFRRFYSIVPILIIQAVIVAMFALIYWRFAGIVENTPKGPVQISSLCDALYFSGVSFFTIGFGDLVPTGMLRVFVLLQGFLGLLSNAGLAVVLARRYST